MTLGSRAKYGQNTHQQVKSKILERMAEWTVMFRSNPDLGFMEQAYMRLKSQSAYHVKGIEVIIS